MAGHVRHAAVADPDLSRDHGRLRDTGLGLCPNSRRQAGLHPRKRRGWRADRPIFLHRRPTHSARSGLADGVATVEINGETTTHDVDRSAGVPRRTRLAGINRNRCPACSCRGSSAARSAICRTRRCGPSSRGSDWRRGPGLGIPTRTSCRRFAAGLRQRQPHDQGRRAPQPRPATRC